MDESDRELQAIAAGHGAIRDQGVEGARDLAHLVVAFRKELLIEGFPVELADELTREWFSLILADQYLGDVDEDED